jgi:hypothetical protein
MKSQCEFLGIDTHHIQVKQGMKIGSQEKAVLGMMVVLPAKRINVVE